MSRRRAEVDYDSRLSRSRSAVSSPFRVVLGCRPAQPMGKKMVPFSFFFVFRDAGSSSKLVENNGVRLDLRAR